MIKKILKKIIPSSVIDKLKKNPKYGFFGNYKTWDDALKDSKGYDSPVILEKVKEAALKVKHGEAAFERDSVAFKDIERSHILPHILSIGEKEKHLDILDFGGSLGSSYFQNKGFLIHFPKFSWNIVEQEKFFKEGKKMFEDEYLKFYPTIEECLKENKINLCLLSSVLQYLPEPYLFLEKLVSFNIPYIVFDRTAFLPDTDRITVQKVRPGIYDASYPAWFLNEKKVKEILNQNYTLVKEFTSLRNKINLEDTTADEKGFLYQIKQ